MTSRRRTKQALRASLYGWVKWVPVLVAPFAVAVQEVYFSTQVLINDYRSIEITQETRELGRELEILRIEQAQLEALERLDDKAPNLGLVRPGPQQVRTIFYDARTNEVELAEEEPPIRHAAAPAPAQLPSPTPAPGTPEAGAAAPGRLAAMATVPAAGGTATLDESEDHLLGVL